MSERRSNDVVLFFVLACAITWGLDATFAASLARHEAAPPWALGLSGLGAFGPTLAARRVAGARRELAGVFGRWRTPLAWVALALVTPALMHVPATLLEVALGGSPAQWFYPPEKPEQIAALVVFSVGEEFGWRGFAYPRLAARVGAVPGSLILGAVWGLWHLGMLFTPENGAPDVTAVLLLMLQLSLASVVFAWVFEKGNRSMAVAIAFHMGAHIDNIERAPASELRLRVLRFVVLAVCAALAARALAKRARATASV